MYNIPFEKTSGKKKISIKISDWKRSIQQSAPYIILIHH